MSYIIAKRDHIIHTGHRVVGQGGACEKAHGHEYKITFHIEGEVNEIGMVLDFSVIKQVLCKWLDDNWDHKFLMWEQDPWVNQLPSDFGLVVVPFNPTAENMGIDLLKTGNELMKVHGVHVVQIDVQETSKCAVTVTL